MAQVVTITDTWWKNVLDGVISGRIQEIDYWTNNWLPAADKNISTIEIFYQKLLVMRGDVLKCHKDTPFNVYHTYKNNLNSIGLPNSASYNDFESLLKIPFKTVPDPIGNIIFNVTHLSEILCDEYKKRNITLPRNISPMPKVIQTEHITRIKY